MPIVNYDMFSPMDRGSDNGSGVPLTEHNTDDDMQHQLDIIGRHASSPDEAEDGEAMQAGTDSSTYEDIPGSL